MSKRTILFVAKTLLVLSVLTMAVAPASAGHATDSPLNEDDGGLVDSTQEAFVDIFDGDDGSNDSSSEDAAEETAGEWIGL